MNRTESSTPQNSPREGARKLPINKDLLRVSTEGLCDTRCKMCKGTGVRRKYRYTSSDGSTTDVTESDTSDSGVGSLTPFKYLCTSLSNSEKSIYSGIRPLDVISFTHRKKQGAHTTPYHVGIVVTKDILPEVKGLNISLKDDYYYIFETGVPRTVPDVFDSSHIAGCQLRSLQEVIESSEDTIFKHYLARSPVDSMTRDELVWRFSDFFHEYWTPPGIYKREPPKSKKFSGIRRLSKPMLSILTKSKGTDCFNLVLKCYQSMGLVSEEVESSEALSTGLFESTSPLSYLFKSPVLMK